MRNIRIADPRDRVLAVPSATAPTKRSRRSRVRDAILTIPIALLLPAILLLSAPVAASGPTMSATPSSVLAGSKVTVRATAFSADSTGAIIIDWSARALGSYAVNPAGKFKMVVTIPAIQSPATRTAPTRTAPRTAAAAPSASRGTP